jgi:endoglucanase
MFVTALGRRGFMTRTGAAIATAPIAAMAKSTSASSSAKPIKYVGINLSGPDLNANKIPGTVNVDYIWPRAEDIDYWLSKGCNIIRQPFLWERMQPVQFGPLDSAQLRYLDTVVAHVTGAGAVLVVDVHNEGYGYGNLVGSPATPAAALADLWTKLATHYAGNQLTAFGLMNEPSANIGVAPWTGIVNTVLAAIRATGARNTCLVSGCSDDALSFIIDGDAQGMLAVHDPINNWICEVHQYLDTDGYGDSSEVVSPTIGPERVANVTAWARRSGIKLYLGEFGAGPTAAGAVAIGNLLAYLQNNSDVWVAATMWGAFAYPPTYPLLAQPLRLNVWDPQPNNYTDQPQVAPLRAYALGGTARVS